MSDLGGWHIGVYLMLAIDVAAIVSLGVAIAYGTRMWRDAPRDLATVRESDRATRHLYHPGHDKRWLR